MRHLTDIVRNVCSCELLLSSVISLRNDKYGRYRVSSTLYTGCVGSLVPPKEKYCVFHKDSTSNRITTSYISYLISRANISGKMSSINVTQNVNFI